MLALAAGAGRADYRCRLWFWLCVIRGAVTHSSPTAGATTSCAGGRSQRAASYAALGLPLLLALRPGFVPCAVSAWKTLLTPRYEGFHSAAGRFARWCG